MNPIFPSWHEAYYLEDMVNMGVGHIHFENKKQRKQYNRY